MKNTLALTGNEAVAYAMKQINPDVVAAYPITPQTSLAQKFADFVHDGEVDTEMILVESEHSAMSACVGSAAAGARTMTATAANGLALMWEIVYIAASSRLPIVMPVVNRALSGPLNIHCDHSDTMGARDSGWLQLFSEDAQEAYENTIQAVRIAEHPDVMLPVMVALDGFIISHGMENVELLDTEKIREFIGEYKTEHSLLDLKNPYTFGPLDLYDYYFEHKRQQAEAMRNAPEVVKKIGEEFARTFGRKRVPGLIEPYELEDAEVAIVALGSTCGTTKAVIDEMRKEGKKVGLLKIRAFRPFPRAEIVQNLKGKKAVAVFDRSDSFNAVSGPLYSEVTAALYQLLKSGSNVPIFNYIYGLGGRNISLEEIKGVFNNLLSGKVKDEINYLGVRE